MKPKNAMKPKKATKQRSTYFAVVPVATVARLPNIRMRKAGRRAAKKART